MNPMPLFCVQTSTSVRRTHTAAVLNKNVSTDREAISVSVQEVCAMTPRGGVLVSVSS